MVPRNVLQRGISTSVSLEYSLNRDERNAKDRYVWLFGGWSFCSASCGGGTRQKMIVCKDEETGRIVSRRKCPLTTKPIQEIEKCNVFRYHVYTVCRVGLYVGGTRKRRALYLFISTLCYFINANTRFHGIQNYWWKYTRWYVPAKSWPAICLIYYSCTFKWLPGPWEACSTTCGRFGMQLRQLYCVRSGFNGTEVNRNNELEVYRTMVQPSICETSPMPMSSRECNRIPCPGYWIFTNWSSVRDYSLISTFKVDSIKRILKEKGCNSCRVYNAKQEQ